MSRKIERFTQRNRRILHLGQEAATTYHRGRYDTCHLLLGMIREDGSVAGRILRHLGLDEARILAAVLARKPQEEGESFNDFTPAWRAAMVHAVVEARTMKHYFIGSEHLLLGILRSTDPLTQTLLADTGLVPDTVRPLVLEHLEPFQTRYPRPLKSLWRRITRIFG